MLQIALTKGARIGEICRIKWTDVNTEQSTISINEPEKGSNRRTIKVPEKTIVMVNALPKKYGLNIVNPNTGTHRGNFTNLRRRLSRIQQNPRFLQIHLHTFRHHFATEKLRQTKLTQHVHYLSGHKTSISTDRYTHIVDYQGDRYYSAIAKTVEEIGQLTEDGWTCFQEVAGVKVFRNQDDTVF